MPPESMSCTASLKDRQRCLRAAAASQTAPLPACKDAYPTRRRASRARQQHPISIAAVLVPGGFGPLQGLEMKNSCLEAIALWSSHLVLRNCTPDLSPWHGKL